MSLLVFRLLFHSLNFQKALSQGIACEELSSHSHLRREEQRRSKGGAPWVRGAAAGTGDTCGGGRAWQSTCGPGGGAREAGVENMAASS